MLVLVGYATAHGSTSGVAERIASRLRNRGLAADLRAVTEVTDLTRYQAVVLGSAIHGGKWLPEASSFADANAGMLRDRLVWLFSVSCVGDEESMFPPAVARRLRTMRGQMPEVTRLRNALAAKEHRNFAGVVARTDWPPTGRAFFRAMGGRYGDHRNWPAIDAWADHIASEVLATEHPVAGERRGTG